MPPENPSACPFCGSETELASNRRDLPNGHRIAASRHWRECRRLECRATGPRMTTQEAANLAFLQLSALAG